MNPLPSPLIPNTLPKHLATRLGMDRVMRLCKVQFQCRVSRNPRCPIATASKPCGVPGSTTHGAVSAGRCFK